MTNLNPRVDKFIADAKKWQGEYRKLREIVLGCSLEEDVKWGVPCYTVQGRNIVLIHGFKEYCALLFFKGALMSDQAGILIQQTDNVQAGRQVRFTGADQIDEMAPMLRAYVLEAVEVEKSGRKVELKPTAEFNIPEEFKTCIDADPALKTAFEKLTPGRQRAYLLFFSAPKQAQTRIARVDKSIPQIMAGKGLND
jgi:uncharacterized protein YdeI (YjbR/CyaY-like superfamily)